ncbi:SDR family NAD(P)-dependent oxidoreductase [Cellulomonas palmilytica]|uniref:SDR family NAD(P)-dependent oxidoreductase n=1 Tax=Cellulomonas palmilytica TaxID=2608402 RepID=UPI001F278B74|nr:SDR family NAD(P)-dependent oxidoreductase [Cellulomonas palmilytica]UJP39856.1 SDR family NAD(P)-dependent oxidoreductase [Cellulomonas palmilytica]
MSLVLVTGSTDGIGLESARRLLDAGHDVVAHARDAQRAADVRAALPGLRDVVVGDLTSLAQTRALADAATTAAGGAYDAVIHNAGVGGGAPRTPTADGLERILQVNTVAPYVLTALMPRPARLVYLTSGLESDGRATFDDLLWESRPWDGMQAYSDSKLYDVMLAFAVARLWPDVLSTTVDPGWIKTKLGGPDAWDEVGDGAATQVWLATSDDDAARVTGRYLKRFEVLEANPQASDVALQEQLLERLAALTGVTLPR